jgi:two-component system nitrogen regulation response regulator GlnG
MPVITPDIFPTAIADNQSTDSNTIASSTNGADATEPGRALPDLVKRLLSEKSTNVYSEATEYMERFVLLKVLQATDGNQSQAAEILGITRGKLRDRISTYNIQLRSDVALEGVSASDESKSGR